MNGSGHYSEWGKAPGCLPRPAAERLPGLRCAAPTARRAARAAQGALPPAGIKGFGAGGSFSVLGKGRCTSAA